MLLDNIKTILNKYNGIMDGLSQKKEIFGDLKEDYIAMYKMLTEHEDFVKELYAINDTIEVIGKYVGANKKIEIKCKTCGNIWSSTASNLLRGTGCPKCNLSHLEKNTMSYLDKNNIEYIYQINYDDLIGINGGLLSYDFYLPKYNLLVEDQGEQHEHPIDYFGGEEQFRVQQEHDERKREYAKSHNINLLEIWYYDEDNIEEILTKKLNNLKSKCVETVIPA